MSPWPPGPGLVCSDEGFLWIFLDTTPESWHVITHHSDILLSSQLIVCCQSHYSANHSRTLNIYHQNMDSRRGINIHFVWDYYYLTLLYKRSKKNTVRNIHADEDIIIIMAQSKIFWQYSVVKIQQPACKGIFWSPIDRSDWPLNHIWISFWPLNFI